MTTPQDINEDLPEKTGTPTNVTAGESPKEDSADMDVETMGDDELALRIGYSSFDEDPSGASWLGTGFTTLSEELDALGIKDEPFDSLKIPDTQELDILAFEGMKELLTEPQFNEAPDTAREKTAEEGQALDPE